MKKKNLLLGLLLGLVLAFAAPQQAWAKNGSCNITASQDGFDNSGCLDNESPITFTISNAQWEGEILSDENIRLKLGTFEPSVPLSGGKGTYTHDGNKLFFIPKNSWDVKVFKINALSTNHEMCSVTFTTKSTRYDDNTGCTEEDREKSTDKPFDLCKQIPDPAAFAKCETCLGQDGIWTAIGCIDTSSTEGIVGKLMTVGISIAGGIALLMILASAFLFATSEGEPKRTSEAKEILTSAIIGLIFIIFSVTILQFIGVNILKIPGFGE